MILCIAPDTRLFTAARAIVKTGLGVYLAELEQQNLLRTNGQFLGVVTKKVSSLLQDPNVNNILGPIPNLPYLLGTKKSWL